ncbi:DMT family transporter [Pediococcus siamensis]|uniref:DMT family transporter n=1 Tax=Pediococcus siamensis TaxID=381829 RepID=UPI0039A1D563
MFLLALVPVLMGSGLAMQTAVNSKLRQYVVSPYLASAVSFSVGALFLIILTLGNGINPLIPLAVFSHNPWWIWLGGLLGVIGLTVNLLLFPRLGSIQTAVLPIFGQIIMGVVIDQFGLFDSPQANLTWFKLLGLILVTVGMLIATNLFSHGAKSQGPSHHNKRVWQLLGIGAGLLMASQTAINGHLGVVLGSSVHAAMVSFTVGAAILIILVLALRVPLHGLQTAGHAAKSQWWIWIGGFLGALYVFGSAWLVPQIGTGQVVVIALFGQLFFSALIDHFGLFDAAVNRVILSRVFGLFTMFVGVISVHFL